MSLPDIDLKALTDEELRELADAASTERYSRACRAGIQGGACMRGVDHEGPHFAQLDMWTAATPARMVRGGVWWAEPLPTETR